jgi:DNA repair exonuclease SbcCD ATPase subunit
VGRMMKFWETLGYKKPETPEEVKEKQIMEKRKEIMSIERRLETLRENIGGGRSGGGEITTQISIMEEQIIKLNKEIEGLGGKPLGTYAYEHKAREGGLEPQGKKP